MRLDLCGLASLELPDVASPVARFLVNEFPLVRGTLAEEVPALRVEYDDSMHARSWRGRRNVGRVVFESNGRLAISDGADALCEIEFDGNGRSNRHVRMHPNFKPGRFYYEVLIPFWRRAMLAKGATFIHASAWQAGGRVTVVSAWGGTGKTNLMLAHLRAGAVYFGDDLVIVTREGHIVPFTRRINVFGYNAEAVGARPEGWSRRWRLRIGFAGVVRRVATVVMPQHAAYLRSLEKRATQVMIEPEVVGGQRATTAAPVDELFVMVGSEGGEPERRVLQSDTVSSTVNALIANLRSEFSNQQATRDMASILTGVDIPRAVTEEDREVLDSFLLSVVSRSSEGRVQR